MTACLIDFGCHLAVALEHVPGPRARLAAFITGGLARTVHVDRAAESPYPERVADQVVVTVWRLAGCAAPPPAGKGDSP